MIRYRDWGDLDARARGLRGRLLGRARLVELAGLDGPNALARALQAVDGGPADVSDARGVERLSRRIAGERLALLARWAGPRTAALRGVFGEEERRALRSLLRGALQGVDAGVRLAGLVPTPALPDAALDAAAHESSVDGVVAAIAVVDHPWSDALREVVEAGPFDAFDLERALDRRFAADALGAARRGGTRLVEYARQAIDLRNAWLALAWDRTEAREAETGWSPGGAALDREAFADATRIEDPGVRRDRLAVAFGAAVPGPALADRSIPLSRLEDAALRARILWWEGIALAEPLSPAPLLAYVLRARAEAVDLRRLAWGLALGAGPDALTLELVTP